MIDKNSYMNTGKIEQSKFIEAMFSDGGIEKVMTTNDPQTLKENAEKTDL